jgi:hypothetical protein
LIMVQHAGVTFTDRGRPLMSGVVIRLALLPVEVVLGGP